MIMDSSQLHRPIYSSSGHEIRQWRWKVRTLIVEKHPFKGAENYFPDSLLYQYSLETNDNPQPENSDSGNKVDTEPEPEEECLWELNPLVTRIDKLNFNNTANDAGEWYVNENLDLAYLSVLASDSIPSNTSTDVDSDLLSIIDTLTHCTHQ